MSLMEREEFGIEKIIQELQEAVDLGDAPKRGPFAVFVRKEYLVEAIAMLRTHPDAQPNEPQGDGWISVEDKDNPPPEAEKVMAYLKFRHGDLRETAYYMGEDGWYYTGVEAPHHGVVTHWRPLPDPPKEEV